jgi:HlyD family secretion protein
VRQKGAAPLKFPGRRKVGIILLALAILVVGGAGAWWLRSQSDQGPIFHTAQVKRGDLLASISATGTVEPTVVVIVGAQVNGLIKSFGKDKYGKTVDYASVVEEGTVLANIDDSLYVAARDAAQAQLAQSTANKTSADANVLQMKAKLLQAQQDWDRAKKLGPSDALSKSAYDQYYANHEVAKANLAAAEAAVEQTKASMAQSRAALNTAQLNLGYCTIKAPVKGVIIDRQVNIGQTVVASLSAPSLFLLAKDLKRVTVWISVNEADVGSIYPGQPVTFTVDAFPDREFKGEVGKIRLNATMTQNVVTYTVEVNTDNDDGKLLPYLTANAKFITGRRENALLVPNAALRWSPQPDQIAPEARKKRHEAQGSKREKRGGSESAGTTRPQGNLWVTQGTFVRPIHVNVGLTDGAFTEVTGKEVTDGMAVVIGETTKDDKAGTATARSPLMPQSIGRGQQQGQTRSDSPNPGAVHER